MNNEIHFVSPAVSETDKDVFFGPLTDTDVFLPIEPHYKLCNLMGLSGIFPSIGQARKNGWDLEIPKGYSEYTVGKLKKRIWVLNL